MPRRRRRPIVRAWAPGAVRLVSRVRVDEPGKVWLRLVEGMLNRHFEGWQKEVLRDLVMFGSASIPVFRYRLPPGKSYGQSPAQAALSPIAELPKAPPFIVIDEVGDVPWERLKELTER